MPAGLIDFWGIDDHGYDNLGLDRPHLQPEVDYRYRFLLQHRQELPDGFQLTVEGGARATATSSRNTSSRNGTS